MARSERSIIKGMQQEHDRLVGLLRQSDNQVARLEAANAALAAALDWYAEQGHWRQDTVTEGYRIILHDDLEEEADGRMMGGRHARAALSPDAGKEKDAEAQVRQKEGSDASVG